MKPKSTDDLWHILINRIRMFNSITGERVPKIYKPNYPPKKDDLYRIRNDMDQLVEQHDITEGEYSFRSYITTRYMIESVAELGEG